MVTRRLAGHLALALVLVLLFTLVHAVIGHIDVRSGEGYDGADYAAMLKNGWVAGSVFSRLRPLVVWLNQPAFALTGNVVRAFDIMNVVYVGVLGLLLSVLMERYGAPWSARAIAIACVGLSNGLRLPAYYPVLIDLGACVFITLAILLIVSGPRWAAAVACVAAVLAREFAPAVIMFGVHRDLRHGARWRTITATYLPASVVYLVLRIIVARISVTEGNSLRVFLGNLVLWQDPMWIGLFTYFSVTYIGGLTLVTAADVSGVWRLLREEHEWASFVLPITIAAALVGPDVWRYLVALTPAALVFYARCASQWTRQERIALSITAVALTLWTQRPWEPMNLTRYFTEWFPYYAWRGTVPEDVPLTALWPDWGIRFLVVGLSMVAVTVYTQRRGSAALIST